MGVEARLSEASIDTPGGASARDDAAASPAGGGEPRVISGRSVLVARLLTALVQARGTEETQVTEHFTEHDLRAKCASDAESLEHARAMLAHADARTTEAIYRRRPERVNPAR